MSAFQPSRRRILRTLGGAWLCAALPLRDARADPHSDALTFLAVGDWGRHGHDHQRDVARRMGETAARRAARFVISVGDNFYQNGVSSVHDPAWRTSFEDVYTARSLHIPWHVALGNHDYRGNVLAQLEYSRTSARWRLPSRWYSVSERSPGGTHIEVFFLDTSPMIQAYYADGARVVKVADQKSNVPVQLKWLDAALGASKADWKVVVGHHPIYMGRATGPLSRFASHRRMREAGGMPEMIALVDPILQRHRVPLYLNGHIHELQHEHRGATHYVCTGAGSKTADFCDEGGSDFCSRHSGFVSCTADRSSLRVGYRDFRGVELHVVDIARHA